MTWLDSLLIPCKDWLCALFSAKFHPLWTPLLISFAISLIAFFVALVKRTRGKYQHLKEIHKRRSYKKHAFAQLQQILHSSTSINQCAAIKRKKPYIYVVRQPHSGRLDRWATYLCLILVTLLITHAFYPPGRKMIDIGISHAETIWKLNVPKANPAALAVNTNESVNEPIYADYINFNENDYQNKWSAKTWNALIVDHKDTLDEQWTFSSFGSSIGVGNIISDDGYGDSTCLEITYSHYETGEARWKPGFSTLTPGKYTVNMGYKTQISNKLRVVVEHRIDGSDQSLYDDLIDPKTIHQNWQLYQAEFTVPDNTIASRVFMIIECNGTLRIDDYSISRYPDEWSVSAYGSSTVFWEIANDGYDDNSSLKLTVNDYDGFGEIRWIPVSIPILAAGKNYRFSLHYKTNPESKLAIKVEYQLSSGKTQFEDLPSPKITDENWQFYSSDFEVPADATASRVFMLIASNGYLQTDNYLIAEYPNLNKWLFGHWGSLSATYEAILVDGYNDNSSLKISVTNYEYGDAKLIPPPIATPTLGKTYEACLAYKTNLSSKLKFVVEHRLNTTDEPKRSIWPIDSSNDNEWQLYQKQFIIPANTIETTAYILIESNGYLQIDNYSISEYHHQGLARPLLSIMFYNGNIDNMLNALPILEKYALPATHLPSISTLNTDQSEINSLKLISRADNQEIGVHALDLSDNELEKAKKIIEDIVVAPVSICTTSFDTIDNYTAETLSRHYDFFCNLTEGYNSIANFDPYNIRVIIVKNPITTEEVVSWIKQGIKDNAWTILAYQQVGYNANNENTITPIDFEAQMYAITEMLSQKEITAKTCGNALYEIKLQIK